MKLQRVPEWSRCKASRDLFGCIGYRHHKGKHQAENVQGETILEWENDTVPSTKLSEWIQIKESEAEK